jgi:hypothetical protein
MHRNVERETEIMPAWSRNYVYNIIPNQNFLAMMSQVVITDWLYCVLLLVKQIAGCYVSSFVTLSIFYDSLLLCAVTENEYQLLLGVMRCSCCFKCEWLLLCFISCSSSCLLSLTHPFLSLPATLISVSHWLSQVWLNQPIFLWWTSTSWPFALDIGNAKSTTARLLSRWTDYSKFWTRQNTVSTLTLPSLSNFATRTHRISWTRNLNTKGSCWMSCNCLLFASGWAVDGRLFTGMM